MKDIPARRRERAREDVLTTDLKASPDYPTSKKAPIKMPPSWNMCTALTPSSTAATYS